MPVETMLESSQIGNIVYCIFKADDKESYHLYIRDKNTGIQVDMSGLSYDEAHRMVHAKVTTGFTFTPKEFREEG